MSSEEQILNFGLFLAWIAKEGETSDEAWARHKKKLVKANAGYVESAEDFATTVMLEAASTFKPQYRESYDEPARYIFGVAAHWRSRSVKRINVPLPDLPTPNPEGVRPRPLQLCLDELHPQKRELLLQYMNTPHGNGREELAKRFEMPSVEALRTRKSRILSEVYDCLGRRGVRTKKAV